MGARDCNVGSGDRHMAGCGCDLGGLNRKVGGHGSWEGRD
jgi:hypothetical protein